MTDIDKLTTDSSNKKLASQIEILLMESCQPFDIQMVALEIVAAKLMTNSCQLLSGIEEGLQILKDQTRGFSIQFLSFK